VDEEAGCRFPVLRTRQGEGERGRLKLRAAAHFEKLDVEDVNGFADRSLLPHESSAEFIRVNCGGKQRAAL
jgi:hypothetical protein